MRALFIAFFMLSFFMTNNMLALAQELSETVEEEKGFVYNDHGKRDPFWPLVNASGVIINYEKDLLISDMMLEGIMVEKEGNSVAIINGMIVKPTDTIGLFTIKKIDPRAVILQKGGETFILKLKEE